MNNNEQISVAVLPEDVKLVGIVGTGLIGSAWASYYLARGLDVIATDPHPQAEARLRRLVEKAWPALRQQGLADGASPDRLVFTTSVDKALKNADFIQESTPEDVELKDNILSAIDKACRPNIVIASSTSGIMPTQLQKNCRHPERVVVGHPFNPVYLMPLVEVVGGEQTSPAALRWAMNFYRHIGKWPLHCRTETPGHLANRLQEALFREMLHLINEGVATTAELDAALTGGPGLRWALLGSCINFYMGGGGAATSEGLFDWYGPNANIAASKLPPPEMTPKLADRIVEGVQQQSASRSLDVMEAMRDEFLIGLLKLRNDINAKYGFHQSRFISVDTNNT